MRNPNIRRGVSISLLAMMAGGALACTESITRPPAQVTATETPNDAPPPPECSELIITADKEKANTYHFGIITDNEYEPAIYDFDYMEIDFGDGHVERHPDKAATHTYQPPSSASTYTVHAQFAIEVAAPGSSYFRDGSTYACPDKIVVTAPGN